MNSYSVFILILEFTLVRTGGLTATSSASCVVARDQTFCKLHLKLGSDDLLNAD